MAPEPSGSAYWERVMSGWSGCGPWPGNRRQRLLVTTALAGGMALLGGVALAKTPSKAAAVPLPPLRPAALAATDLHSTPFDIPAGDLAPALKRWAAISRVQMLASSHEMRGLRCAGLEGTYAPEGALKALLFGTGLDYQYTAAGVVAIINPEYAQLRATAPADSISLEEISVVGARDPGQPPPTGTIGQPPPSYAGGQVGSGTRAGLLGNQSVFATPFSITGFTEKLIKDQQARTFADVVQNDSSVRYASSRGGGGDELILRGFQTGPGAIAFDGIYGITDGRRPVIEGIERVELLKGPSALVNGVSAFSGIGGSINLIPKRAFDEPLTRVTTGFVSRREFGTHVDVGRRFGPSNDWGIRTNLAYRDGQSPIDNVSVGLQVATLGLDYRGDRFRFSLDLSHQNQDTRSQQTFLTVVPGLPIPRAPKGTLSQNQPWEFSTARQQFGVARAEFDVAPNVTIFGAYGVQRAEEISLLGFGSIFNARGDFNASFGLSPAEFRTQTGEAGLRARFETGPVSHRFAIVGTQLEGRTDFGSSPVGSGIVSNLYRPVYVPEPFSRDLPRDAPKYATDLLRGVAVADTLSILEERIMLTLGGRLQRIEGKLFSPVSKYDESRLSPAIALVIKPTEKLSLYGNAVEGLNRGEVAPAGTSNAGQAFPPFVSKQVEVGAKYDFGTFGVSAAVFEIKRPSAFADPVTRRFGVDGEQRNRGLELSAFGEPSTGFRLLGGVTFLDAVLTKTPGDTDNGNRATGAPDVQLNLYAEYDLPRSWVPGLTLTGRAVHATSQFYDQANTQKVPAWTRFDLGARYVLNREEAKPVILRANIENVADLDYYETTASGFLVRGAPRTFFLSASIEF